MSNVIAFLKANWQWMVPTLSVLLLNVANGLKSYPTASSKLLWLHSLLDRLTVVTNANSPRTLKLPLVRSKPPVGSASANSAGISSAAVALLLLIVPLAAACQCFGAQAQKTLACAVVNDIIDCSEDQAIETLGPVVEQLVVNFIDNSGGKPDWSALLASLEQAGLKDGGCLVARVEADLANGLTAERKAMPDKAAAVHDLLTAYKSKHGLVSVKFKVKVGGKVVLL